MNQNAVPVRSRPIRTQLYGYSVLDLLIWLDGYMIHSVAVTGRSIHRCLIYLLLLKFRTRRLKNKQQYLILYICFRLICSTSKKKIAVIYIRQAMWLWSSCCTYHRMHNLSVGTYGQFRPFRVRVRVLIRLRVTIWVSVTASGFIIWLAMCSSVCLYNALHMAVFCSFLTARRILYNLRLAGCEFVHKSRLCHLVISDDSFCSVSFQFEKPLR